MCASEFEAWHSTKSAFTSLQFPIRLPDSMARATGLPSDHLLVFLSRTKVTTELATMEGASVSSAQESIFSISRVTHWLKKAISDKICRFNNYENFQNKRKNLFFLLLLQSCTSMTDYDVHTRFKIFALTSAAAAEPPFAELQTYDEYVGPSNWGYLYRVPALHDVKTTYVRGFAL